MQRRGCHPGDRIACPSHIANSSGFICMSMPPARLEELRLPPLLPATGSSEDPKGTAYHLTLDANSAKHPTTTGISAHDRAFACRLVASGAGPDDFTRPGHVVPLRYKTGGTRVRFGHTEAAVGECGGQWLEEWNGKLDSVHVGGEGVPWPRAC